MEGHHIQVMNPKSLVLEDVSMENFSPPAPAQPEGSALQADLFAQAGQISTATTNIAIHNATFLPGPGADIAGPQGPAVALGSNVHTVALQSSLNQNTGAQSFETPTKTLLRHEVHGLQHHLHQQQESY